MVEDFAAVVPWPKHFWWPPYNNDIHTRPHSIVLNQVYVGYFFCSHFKETRRRRAAFGTEPRPSKDWQRLTDWLAAAREARGEKVAALLGESEATRTIIVVIISDGVRRRYGQTRPLHLTIATHELTQSYSSPARATIALSSSRAAARPSYLHTNVLVLFGVYTLHSWRSCGGALFQHIRSRSCIDHGSADRWLSTRVSDGVVLVGMQHYIWVLYVVIIHNFGLYNIVDDW